MKKLSFFLFLLVSVSSFGQETYFDKNQDAATAAKTRYFTIGLMYDYAIADPSQIIGQTNTSSSAGVYSGGTASLVKGSYGKGSTPYLCIEYCMKNNISFDVNLGYHIGPSYSTASDQIITSVNGTNSIDVTETNEKHEFKNISQYQLNGIIKYSGGKKKFKPYFKAGVVFGLGNKMTEDISNLATINQISINGDSAYSTTNTITKQYSKGLSVGCVAGIGLDWRVAEKFVVFAEAAYIGMSWAPKQSTITSYTFNGVDLLSSLPSSTVNTTYGNTATTSPVVPTGQGLRSNIPYSSINFMLGVRYVLKKKVKQ